MYVHCIEFIRILKYETVLQYDRFISQPTVLHTMYYVR
jgi:hypothetical protein